MLRRSASIGVFLASMAVLTIAFSPPTARAASETEDLRQRVETMEKMLQGLKQRLDESEKSTKQAQKDAAAAEKKATEAANIAGADATRDIKWHFAGFGKTGFTGTSTNATHSRFGTAAFNPIFIIDYKDLLSFEGELEVAANSTAGTKTALEFANMNLKATDWLTVTAGKFLSPIGDFQQHLHPAWINKLPDRPAGFDEDGGALPLGDVGVQLRGAFPLGNMTANYAVFVTNGPQLSDEAVAGIKLEGFAGDNNDDKAVGGRIGLNPVPYINLGFSGMRSQITGNVGAGGAVTSSTYYLVGADAAYTKGAWDIRGEYIRSHLGSLMTAPDSTDTTTQIPATRWQTWYAQIAYRLSGLTDNKILGNFEPVVRFSQLATRGFTSYENSDERRWTVGLDYWFAPSLVAKLAYERRRLERQRDATDIRLQLAFGF